MSDVQGNVSRPIESDNRLVAALIYGLFLFSIVTHGVTAVVGVIIAYVKRGDARGTIFESHYSNAITVFWVTLIFWTLIIAATIAGVAGLFASFGPDVWHWHAHEWTAQVHDWSAQIHDHVVPHDWWPVIAFLPLAWLGFVTFFVWYLYRVIRGLVRVLENKPY